MQFERLVSLAENTATGVLCEAWSAPADDVLGVKSGKRPMTIREVGALAEVHGMKLEDILAI